MPHLLEERDPQHQGNLAAGLLVGAESSGRPSRNPFEEFLLRLFSSEAGNDTLVSIGEGTGHETDRGDDDMRLCGCGCGQATNSDDREFLRGHHRKHKVNLINRMRQGDRRAMQELSRRGWYDYRQVGIELEVLIPRDIAYNREEAKRLVAERLREAGVEAWAEGYNHATKDHWKVVPDASVAGDGYYGVEVVSPPLKGRETWWQIEAVCDTLDELGAVVNRSCGLHVHVDADDLAVGEIQNLVRTYIRHEGELDQRVAPSRRGDHNTYCRSLSTMIRTGDMERAWTKHDLAASSADRYAKLNLKALTRHGTVEFRQHQGTRNTEKVSHWVDLVVRMVDLARCGGSQGFGSIDEQLGLSDEDQAWWQERIRELS